MSILKINYFWMVIGLFFLCACTKKPEPIFEINTIELEQIGANKPNIKSAQAFISIAYQDVFEQTIPKDYLDHVTRLYLSFGDVTIINDLVLRNFLNHPQVKIPTKVQMHNTPTNFIHDCFNKLFNRPPKAQELWYFNKMITENEDLAPKVVYMALMSTQEYQKF